MIDWSLFQNQLGISFEDLTLLQQALVHRSYLNENPDFSLESNERLEFLGDALLGFVVAEDLYRRFAGMDEGEMTKLRSALVRQDSLARLASSLKVGDYLYLGQGEEKGGGRRRPRNLACALEALIAAIFIDQGFASAKDFVLKLFGPRFKQMMEEGLADYKSSLQELAQARKQGRPLYHLVNTEGPDHDRRFTVEVWIGVEVLGRGYGKSKQLAEKEAAKEALDKLSEG
ncbi:ribonuclease III [Chloroflexota bacterium]